MKKVYVLLMHTETLPSKVVKTFTRYEYSHVAISLDEKCNIIYSFGRKSLHSIVDGGFSIEMKNGEFFSTFDKTKCIIYEVAVSDRQYLKLASIIQYMEEHKEEYKYDFAGIVFRFFRLPVTFKKKYVCSQFIAYILQKCDIYTFNKKVCFVKPQDFENLNGFNEIYRGAFKAYC